jgi:hypothetical protein
MGMMQQTRTLIVVDYLTTGPLPNRPSSTLSLVLDFLGILTVVAAIQRRPAPSLQVSSMID